MPNRPSRPLKGSSYNSAGHGAGQIIRSLFDTGGPALNPEFGQDPMTAEGRPVSKHGADEIYQQPTLAQRFFNPTAVAQAQREQAAYRVQQIVSKQEAERHLNDTLAIERFRQQAANEQWRRQQEVANAERVQRNYELMAQEDVANKRKQEERAYQEKLATDKNADFGKVFPFDSLPKGIGPVDDATRGRLGMLIAGTDMNAKGLMALPYVQSKLQADTSIVSDPRYKDAQIAKMLTEGFVPTGPGTFNASMNPSIGSIMGQTKEIVSTPGAVPGLPPVESERIIAPKQLPSEQEKAARIEAIRNAPAQTESAPLPVSKASENPYREQAAAMTADTDLAADRAQLSDYVQALRNLNARIKEGGIIGPTYTEDGYVFQADTEAEKLKVLKEAADVEDKRKVQLQKLTGRRPLSKQ